MADKNRELAEAVVAAVGGSANITSVAHCMTRLRFVLKDQSIPKKAEVEKIKGVMGTNIAGGQPEEKKKVNPITAALEFISGCMAPLFPAIIAAV